MSKKIERQINLLSFFLCHRFLVPWSRIRDEFYGGIENEDSAKRMFERDKEDLQNIGIKIECIDKSAKQEEKEFNDTKKLIDIEDISDLCDESDTLLASVEFPLYYDGSARYKVIKENLYLPELSLSIKEKMALYFLGKIISKEEGFPMKDALKMAVSKLSFDMPILDDKDAVETFEKNFTFRLGVKNISDKVVKNIRILDEAVISSKKVSFRYYTIYRDKESDRDVDPYGLMLHNGSWYLVGKCHNSNSIKVFKISRIKGNVKVNKVKPKTPDFKVPEDFNIKDFYEKQPWDLGEGEVCEVKVKINSKFVWWVKDRWGDKGKFRMEDDGAGILEIPIRNIDAFIRWVLQFGTGVEVLSPGAIREKLKQKIEHVLEEIKV